MAKWTDISARDAVVEMASTPAKGREHLPSPAKPDIHDLINAITAVGLGINANLLWLDRENPDVEAARRTAKKLIDDFARMERLVSNTLIEPR